ncbi:unnamed protein product [Paramecium pentaurelia]|uniref:phenylalanine--tRNA ligase n=1 Tax=Paramecium pentaurelia TaxID=43138 RepID=A0A8S1S2T6_9CILI|nr:unnamed protein product [Paramecium pentaurelia]
MPKISSDKKLFFKLLGKELNEEELEELLFRFGIEAEEREEEPDLLYFEIAANRPDLLCIENLVHALRIYMGLEKKRIYSFTPAKETIYVKAATQQIRPFVVGAILRDVTLTEDSFKSFLSFQDKIHQNYARKRTLVSIGTHDLDKIEGPFFYDAQAPQDIVFQALKQTEQMNCIDLFNKLREDQYLKGYLKIIENSPVYPVIYDNQKRVCSLPPIINGEHSKMSAETKNILIEVTAIDEQRALDTLNCLISGFAIYNNKLNIEKVNIVYESNNKQVVTPVVDERTLTTNIQYINKVLGINITTQQASDLLSIIGIQSVAKDDNILDCQVPFYRSDILQQCDIAEEIGIAYDYNKIEFKVPETATTGSEYRLNKLSDMVREEVALCGFVECLNFVLMSIDEQTKMLNRPNLQNYVSINNSKTPQFQSVRSTLIPGILHTLQANSDSKLPIKLFEVSDVCVKGLKSEKDGFQKGEGQVGAYNQRNLVAIHSSSKKSELEILHGLLDQLMIKLRVKKTDYHLKQSNDPLFFHQLQAQIIYKDQPIGGLGVVHPEVLERFDWKYPVTLLEMNIQVILNDF